MKRYSPIQRMTLRRRKTKPHAGTDPKYLNWIRTLACLVCLAGEQVSLTEAAHTGVRGLGQKAPDRQAVPLCAAAHHRLGPESYHVLGKAFCEHHSLDIAGVVTWLNTRYDNLTMRITPQPVVCMLYAEEDLEIACPTAH